MNLKTILLVAGGLFALAGAVMDWDWFMNHRRASLIKTVLRGRRNARIFYALLGIGLAVMGVLGMAGIIDLSG